MLAIETTRDEGHRDIKEIKMICRGLIKERNSINARQFKEEQLELKSMTIMKDINRWQDFKIRRDSIVFAYIKARKRNECKIRFICQLKAYQLLHIIFKTFKL